MKDRSNKYEDSESLLKQSMAGEMTSVYQRQHKKFILSEDDNETIS